MLKPEFIQSPNWSTRRKPISAIVIHYTDSMTIESPISWFKQEISKVSAHYLIGRDGRVVQMVLDEHVAWHAGHSHMKPPADSKATDAKAAWREPNVNGFSLGIELVGTADSGFTDRQLASLYDLLAVLVQRYKIPPERVVGHLHISPGRKIDPDGHDKQFPWAKTQSVVTLAYQAVSG